MCDNNKEYPTRLPTEDEIESEAERNKWLFGAVRMASVERMKFLAMAFLFTSIVFTYSFARELKDVFMLERQSVASIYGIKTFVMPLIVIMATMILQSLYTRFNNKTILFYSFTFFGIYFSIYGFLILPFRDYIEAGPFKDIDLFSDEQLSYKGADLIIVPLGIIFRWTSSMHFIMSETWGTIVLSVLFMSFAGDVCPMNQFQRFMPLFLLFGNVGLIFSAIITFLYSQLKESVSFVTGNRILIGVFGLFGFLCFACVIVLKWLDKNVLARPMYTVKVLKKRQKKEKVGFFEAMKVMSTSKFALAMCVMVISYNMMTNMTEVNQKSCINVCAKSENKDVGSHYLKMQCINQLITGIFVIIFILSPLQRLIETRGWLAMAIIPPIVGTIMTGMLTLMAFINTSTADKCKIPYISPIGKYLGIILPFISIGLEEKIGTIAVATYKILKYGPFDISKETIGRRIDGEYRPRLKGVYDGLCGKLGKSFGSLLSVIIFTILGKDSDVRETSLIYFFIGILFSAIWFISVFYLNYKFNESIEKNTTIDLDLIKVGGTSNEE
ncbi:ADP,ATP carrier protein 2 [Dictyocoela muelleri]|nr:ADP,ATP carrier protein 2 [Dictyocoela muelleri]